MAQSGLRFERLGGARQFRAAGVKSGDTVATYCYIGMQASLLYFTARYLGYDAHMFDGSFEEWSNRKDLPGGRAETRHSPARSPESQASFQHFRTEILLCVFVPLCLRGPFFFALLTLSCASRPYLQKAIHHRRHLPWIAGC